MGVDRKLFINSKWDVEDIQDLLESIPEVSKIKLQSTQTPSYVVILFTYDGAEGKEQRQMNFHYNTEEGGFRGNQISLGLYGSSDVILTKIAERIGGFYTPQDCNDELRRFDYPAHGNLDFMLKHAILRGKCDGRQLEEFVKDHEEVSAGWKKSQSKLKL